MKNKNNVGVTSIAKCQLSDVVTGQLSIVNCSQRGFTLLELVVVVAIIAVVGAISIPGLIALVKSPQLSDTAEEIISTLKLAQNKTLSSEGNSQYGVYFNTASSPNQYILFKGASYATRDASQDKTYTVPSITELYAVSAKAGLGIGSEVVFDRLTASTVNSGSVSLRLKEDATKTKVIYIDSSGVVGYTATSTPSDTRIKDSRHVDFNYSRVINTATENLVLTFNGNTVQTIPITSNLNNGQIDWTGTVAVGGVGQTVRIHTLRLNNPDTLFSVFRDMRYNTVSLTISLSADITGTIAEYTANGTATTYHSIYVNNFAWQ